MYSISKTRAMLILSAVALGAAGCAVEAAPDQGPSGSDEAAPAADVGETAGNATNAETRGEAVAAEDVAPVKETTQALTAGENEQGAGEDVGTSQDPIIVGGLGGWGWGGLGGWGLGTGLVTYGYGYPGYGFGWGLANPWGFGTTMVW